MTDLQNATLFKVTVPNIEKHIPEYKKLSAKDELKVEIDNLINTIDGIITS
jgi:hypothetical protein